ncbi:DUF1738 domain-containing protein [Chitinophaga lutea]|uniref:DUF1738 domain-containing protein n=1 Tax=Chitinophaga lutea TaxID=2488634 RepID=A0A3N4Q1V3_9BACT|nr:zincin-like metallopeptidase domain-containing protein [Chitinophaga lutea]RPE13189.1 DUF1738 domain-containing protein [Chitinophaga lutea]
MMKQATTARRDIHQEVTDIIIRQLETGTIPWRKPWDRSKKMQEITVTLPENGTTGSRYRGINILMLWGTFFSNGYTSPQWASYKQWGATGQQVRKGEKATMIVYYNTREVEKDGEIEKIPFIRFSYVFNRCQLDSYDPGVTDSTPAVDLVDRIAAADEFVTHTGATVLHDGGNRAFYRHADDSIHMPPPPLFIDTPGCSATEGYYSTLLHELTHWTGAPHRMARNMGKTHGDRNYADEELVAELGAAFLCAGFGINRLDNGQHAAYIQSWLPKLKDSKYAIFTAASEASKAVDFLYQLQPHPVTETAELVEA